MKYYEPRRVVYYYTCARSDNKQPLACIFFQTKRCLWLIATRVVVNKCGKWLKIRRFIAYGTTHYHYRESNKLGVSRTGVDPFISCRDSGNLFVYTTAPARCYDTDNDWITLEAAFFASRVNLPLR